MRRVLLSLISLPIVALAGAFFAAGLSAQNDASGVSNSPDSNSPDTNSPGAGAQPTSNKPNGNKPAAKGKNRPPLAITPEREAAAMTFVERNHAELAGLLAHLKENQPRQYEQAVREIYRVTERLAGFQERDPLHYELEVKLWTAQSRVQLLAARLKMDQSDEHRQQLREALSAQIAARLDVLKHQRDQASQRLEKMDKEISRLETGREAMIDKQLETLAKVNSKAAPKSGAGKRGGKGANGRKADKKAAD